MLDNPFLEARSLWLL